MRHVNNFFIIFTNFLIHSLEIYIFLIFLLKFEYYLAKIFVFYIFKMASEHFNYEWPQFSQNRVRVNRKNFRKFQWEIKKKRTGNLLVLRRELWHNNTELIEIDSVFSSISMEACGGISDSAISSLRMIYCQCNSFLEHTCCSLLCCVGFLSHMLFIYAFPAITQFMNH